MKLPIRHVANVATALAPRKIRSSMRMRRIINDFCEQFGLVYFGYVSQRSDDHHIVRGLTVSNAHKDDHYCIGSYDGYDIIVVERSDTIHTNHHHVWHIMEIDLRNAQNVPHIFIGSPTHGLGFHSLLTTKYPHLYPAHLGVFGHHSTEFSKNFKLYSKPDQWLVAEKIFTPDITAMIGKHFRGLVLEVYDDSLYVYTEKASLTVSLLETMLKNGTWLAKIIDTKYQPDRAGM